jgi:hypothetical protein
MRAGCHVGDMNETDTYSRAPNVALLIYVERQSRDKSKVLVDFQHWYHMGCMFSIAMWSAHRKRDYLLRWQL